MLHILIAVTLKIIIFSSTTCAQIQFFPDGFTSDNVVSTACATALNATIDCNSMFAFYPNLDYQGPFNSTALDQFCSVNCFQSLATYHDAVVQACDNDPDPWDGITATFGGDRLWAYQNRTCLKDKSTGGYCSGRSLYSYRDSEISSQQAYTFVAVLNEVVSCQYWNSLTCGIFFIK